VAEGQKVKQWKRKVITEGEWDRKQCKKQVSLKGSIEGKLKRKYGK
jgi:hypothetical protein